MTMRLATLLALTALSFTAAALPLASALAQIGTGSPGGEVGPGTFGQPNSGSQFTPAGVPRKDPGEDEDRPHGGDDDKQAPPPAIPGATPGESAAPAERSAGEMSPNDALFDAISRGDLAGAKDALNRGAQLDAKNMLGQTPMDASIDLDRNDITFLLLSMRGAQPSAGPVRQAAEAPPAAPAGKHGRHGRKAVVEASAAAAQPKTGAPALSTDRGQPNPGAGFIGF